MAVSPKTLEARVGVLMGFLVLGFIFKLQVLVYVATALAVVWVLIPSLGRVVDWIWAKLGFVLGWVNGRILLGAVFFIFLTPIALLYRLFSKNPLQLKKPEGTTFYVRDHAYTPQDLEESW